MYEYEGEGVRKFMCEYEGEGVRKFMYGMRVNAYVGSCMM